MKAVTNHEEIQSGEISGSQAKTEEFYPRGAIAFFVSMLIGFGLIWAALYALMLHRQFHL